jgi:crotonobetaine/carnitine-CoA ligase
VIADADHAGPVASACLPHTNLLLADQWLSNLGQCEEGPTEPTGGCIIYTSGTTGRPKGVRWRPETQARHGTVYAAELVPLRAGEHAYCCLPLFHVTATGVTMASLLQGAWVHLDRRFSASTFWRRVVETESVFFPYVGTILSVLMKDERPALRHGVRFAMGAAAPVEVFTSFEDRFGIRLLETYGQTELASIWLANHVHLPGAVGRSCPRAEFRLMPVDSISGAGELQVRPYDPLSMMSEYYEDPRATAAAWVDGWYRTRDLASVDAEGNYRYVGRLADYVRRRGENVSAYELERAVLRHPDVVEVAVVGVDSDLGEQDIALYYVPRMPNALDPTGLHTWCRANLSDFMVPRYYCAVDEVPKTETQRVQKGLLHARVRLKAAYDAERETVLP